VTGWHGLEGELDRWQEAGLRLDLWLRDDDAVEVTPQLDNLLRLCRQFGAHVLLAVIPGQAQETLAARLQTEPLVRPCQHGWRHVNHAPQGQKSAEFGSHRAVDAMLADIDAGRSKMAALFSDHVRGIFVPPWNRIAPAILEHLPQAGFDRISAFRPLIGTEVDNLRLINPDTDIIDWKNGRILRPAIEVEAEIVARLQTLRCTAERRARLGLLLHHLVHGDDAWGLLDDLMRVFARHAAVDLADPAQL
jgi:hypothetical protein